MEISSGFPLSAALAAALIDSFGSFEAFQELCDNAARGAGSTLLVYDPKTRRLAVMALPCPPRVLLLGWVPRPDEEVTADYPPAHSQCLGCPAAWWRPVSWASLGQRLAGFKLA